MATMPFDADEFFRRHADEREAERSARQAVMHANYLRWFGHYEMEAVPHSLPPGLASCARCRAVREPRDVQVLADCRMRRVHYLTACNCCRLCAGRGYNWVNTPMPPGLTDLDPAPPGWKPYTRKPCKCSAAARKAVRLPPDS
jgi:hypothetical protein